MKDDHKFKFGEKFMPLKGVEENVYIFTQNPFTIPLPLITDIHWPEISCIYALLALSKNPQERAYMIDVFTLIPGGITNQDINGLPWEYVYIGKTENLAKEFVDHPKLKCIMNYEIAMILIKDFPGDVQSEIIINDLLQKFVCNKP